MKFTTSMQPARPFTLGPNGAEARDETPKREQRVRLAAELLLGTLPIPTRRASPLAPSGPNDNNRRPRLVCFVPSTARPEPHYSWFIVVPSV